jgi:predicted MPP superfamily phosphohydrolase
LGCTSLRTRFVVFIGIVQSTLFLAHWFLYQSWLTFLARAHPHGMFPVLLVLGLLSMSFVTASVLAWRYQHFLVRGFYTVAAVWLGFLTFFFVAASSCWMIGGLVLLSGARPNMHGIAVVLFVLAASAGLYSLANAARIRVKRISVRLPNLPESWRGRVAALVSDLHLGPVRGHGFIRRIVAKLVRSQPDIVFIAGDLYDGTAADVDGLTRHLGALSAPFGAYFVAGNHEQFRDHTDYLDAVKRYGLRVLDNEKVTVDGLQIVGVHYRDSINLDRFRSILQRAALDRSRSSILLTHTPDRARIANEEGISLQLSGHTHGGQFFPFTWVASRIYGRFVHGLERLGDLLVYTSCGAGTWGPPLRLGTTPEIVLIQFA